MLLSPEPAGSRSHLSAMPDDAVVWVTRDGDVTASALRDALLVADRELSGLHGRTVALSWADPRVLAAHLLALDGVAAALLLLPADLPGDQAAALIADAGADAVLADRSLPPAPAGLAGTGAGLPATRWVIPTSGTTGSPKLVSHTLATLTRTVRPAGGGERLRWGLLYDLARFAGLQVFFQSLLTGSPLIFSDPAGPLGVRLAALAAAGCTALSATPTLWRKILMTGGGAELPLRQVTLGGEIADASILAALARAYPAARITHIFASTEAGVGFSVHDGRQGFPASYLTEPPGDVEIAVDAGGFLLLRPPRAGQRFVDAGAPLADSEGWINTGDLVRAEGNRFLFLGRANGAINVGGNKVFPEEVEQVIYEVPGVAMAQVKARRSSITGSLVEASVVPAADACDRVALAAAVRSHCRARLPAFKTPAIITVQDAIEIQDAGKMARPA
jgi:acyl-CoA synthetase (AMP-forming)/AMP-acid ligase II